MTPIITQSYTEFLEKMTHFREKLIIILPHEQTDIDAYAASFALKELLHKLNYKCYVYLSKLNKETENYIQKLRLPQFRQDKETITRLLNKEKSSYLLILVDFSSTERLIEPDTKKIALNAMKIYSIDHHITQVSENIAIVLNRPYKSTTEIIADMILFLNYQSILAKKEISLSMVGAILQDTLFLRHANRKTFHILSMIADEEIYEKARSAMVGSKKDISEKIARIKGAQRAQILRIDDTLIAITHIGSYESSVASSLVSLGADIALCISEKRDYVRISGRTNMEIDIANIFINVAKQIDGIAGGHKKAATLMAKKKSIEVDYIVKQIVDNIISYLKNQKN